MKINWKVRLRNKAFWVMIIPAVLLLVSQVARMLGFELDLTGLGDQLKEIVETVFLILALLGVTVDFTTPGVGDSARAMSYVEPGVPGVVEDEYR